jgi:LPS O-antigen subunit length determinant protein (WzzB/FepE family)
LVSSSEINIVKDEIDLADIFIAIWHKKILILLVTFLSVVISVLYLQNATTKYSVRLIYKPVVDNKAPNYGGLQGLASLAMVELPGSKGSNDFEVFRHLVTSEEVGEVILANTDLVSKLFSNEFDEINNTYNMPEMNEVSLIKKKIKSFITGKEAEIYIPPNSARIAMILKKSFSQAVNKKTGFLQFSSESSAPNLTVQLIENAVNASNAILRMRYIESLNSSLNFYQQKLLRAKSREHREALALLIVSEQKKLMLASTANDYAVEPITDPEISLYPTSPNTINILSLGLISGLFLSILIVLLLNMAKNRKY